MQVLQRRTPSWGNRPKDADNAAGSRWRSQPGIVSKAEKSNRQRSKDWSHRTRVGREIGLPASIRVDQGTEFVSRDLDLWTYHRGVTLDFSRPGKPTDNAFIEAFNSRFRAECLNTHWFLSLADAREKMEDWCKYYNEERPHGAIGQKTPIMLLDHDGAASPAS